VFGIRYAKPPGLVCIAESIPRGSLGPPRRCSRVMLEVESVLAPPLRLQPQVQELKKKKTGSESSRGTGA